MTDYVTAGLRQRRAELIKEHDKLRARLMQLGTELGHIDAVIRLFDPEHQSATLHLDARENVSRARGDRSRAVLDVLREAGKPIPAAEVTRLTMLRQGFDPDDRQVRRALGKKIEAALQRQERRGLLRSIRREGQFVVWEVA